MYVYIDKHCNDGTSEKSLYIVIYKIQNVICIFCNLSCGINFEDNLFQFLFRSVLFLSFYIINFRGLLFFIKVPARRSQI